MVTNIEELNEKINILENDYLNGKMTYEEFAKNKDGLLSYSFDLYHGAKYRTEEAIEFWTEESKKRLNPFSNATKIRYFLMDILKKMNNPNIEFNVIKYFSENDINVWAHYIMDNDDKMINSIRRLAAYYEIIEPLYTVEQFTNFFPSYDNYKELMKQKNEGGKRR